MEKRCWPNKEFFQKRIIKLKPLILEQNIPTIQSHPRWQPNLWNTHTIEINCKLLKQQQNEYLNNIIAINPEAVNEARKRDKNKVKITLFMECQFY
jgi:amidase